MRFASWISAHFTDFFHDAVDVLTKAEIGPGAANNGDCAGKIKF